MKKGTWISYASLALLLVVFIAFYQFMQRSEQTSFSPLSSKDIVEWAHDNLDPPFHFLLELEEYQPLHKQHDSDSFSAWGVLVLKRGEAAAPGRSSPGILDLLQSKADARDWEASDELSDMEEIDLEPFQVNGPLSQLNLVLKKTGSDHDEPTVYSCRIQVSGDAEFIFVSYRIDTE